MGAMVVCNVTQDAVRMLGIPKAGAYPCLGHRHVGCEPVILHEQQAGLGACNGIPVPLCQVAQGLVTVRNSIDYIGERNQ